MEFILAVFFAVLGALIGSFLNVVVLRYNTGRGVSRGRSACMVCSAQIQWYDNIPVVSFALLRGRCRSCNTRISRQYPFVEAATAFLFLAIWLSVTTPEYGLFTSQALRGLTTDVVAIILNAIVPALFYMVLSAFLVVIFVYDMRHKIIPNLFVYSFAGLALAGLVVQHWPELLTVAAVADFIAGPLFFLPFFLLWFVSHGRWIGLGDGKLALGIGWMLGLVHGLSAIVLAFWIGAVISILLLAVSRWALDHPHSWVVRVLPKMTLKSEIPFAPFLIVGTIVEFFWQIDVIGLSTIM